MPPCYQFLHHFRLSDDSSCINLTSMLRYPHLCLQSHFSQSNTEPQNVLLIFATYPSLRHSLHSLSLNPESPPAIHALSTTSIEQDDYVPILDKISLLHRHLHTIRIGCMLFTYVAALWSAQACHISVVDEWGVSHAGRSPRPSYNDLFTMDHTHIQT